MAENGKRGWIVCASAVVSAGAAVLALPTVSSLFTPAPTPTPTPTVTPAPPSGPPTPTPTSAPTTPPAAEPTSALLQVDAKPFLSAEPLGSNFSVKVSLRIDIRNISTAPIAIAWHRLGYDSQVMLDEGTALPMSRASRDRATGIEDCRSAPSQCWKNYSAQFTAIPPGGTATALVYYKATIPAARMAAIAKVKSLSYVAGLAAARPDTSVATLEKVNLRDIPLDNQI